MHSTLSERTTQRAKTCLRLPPPRLSAATTCSSQQPSFVIFASQKSLKIAVVNEQPTHFLLKHSPIPPSPQKTIMLSSLAPTSILFRTYPVIIEAEKKELTFSLFRSFNFDGPQIYGVRIPVFGLHWPPRPVNKL